ncbi:hypothetical protein VKT23_020279 [Stygiomarasmius scandens]|uniref:Integrase core domain-containing protein n=1 Tax=Marasmiellus scandens TaxID=2682957 RepID=A0ABR1IJD2_9AGAR
MPGRLPPLPPFPLSPNYLQKAWSPNVYGAYNELHSVYNHASHIVTQEADPTQISAHAERLVGKGLTILLSIEEFAEREHVPGDWVAEATLSLVSLLNELTDALVTAKTKDDSNVYMPQVTKNVYTGKKGRPRKEINVGLLQIVNAPNRVMQRRDFAESLGVSAKTIRRRLQENGLDFKYSQVTDEELDKIIWEYHEDHPSSGFNYVVGHLRSKNLRLQCDRINASLHRVDGLGRVQRTAAHEKLSRHTYKVKRPHALWHLDGHHKLILWGIVIHGIVDGYSHTVVGIRASDNNRASTVLEVFLAAVEDYTLPSRIRGDRGKENKAVAMHIIIKCGLNRGSFIWGS